jgi:hypothetical protein
MQHGAKRATDPAIKAARNEIEVYASIYIMLRNPHPGF